MNASVNITKLNKGNIRSVSTILMSKKKQAYLIVGYQSEDKTIKAILMKEALHKFNNLYGPDLQSAIRSDLYFMGSIQGEIENDGSMTYTIFATDISKTDPSKPKKQKPQDDVNISPNKPGEFVAGSNGGQVFVSSNTPSGVLQITSRDGILVLDKDKNKRDYYRTDDYISQTIGSEKYSNILEQRGGMKIPPGTLLEVRAFFLKKIQDQLGVKIMRLDKVYDLMQKQKGK